MTEDQERRQKGIGGTDISAIVGMNPWRTPLDVFLEKTGQALPREDTEEFWWGREMEPLLAKRYEMETGRIPHFPLNTPWRHGVLSWYIGSPDAIIYSGWNEDIPIKVGGVEFKTSSQPQEWGDPGTDEIPEHYHLQCDWYMGLTGTQWWDLAVLLMGFKREFRIYRIHRDQELIDFLIGEGELFWLNHVVPNIPPELDGSESARQYLNRLYPQDRGPILEPTDEDILLTVQKYIHDRERVATWDAKRAKHENQLKAFIGSAAGMKGPWGRIMWKTNRNGSRIWRPKFVEEE